MAVFILNVTILGLVAGYRFYIGVMSLVLLATQTRF